MGTERGEGPQSIVPRSLTVHQYYATNSIFTSDSLHSTRAENKQVIEKLYAISNVMPFIFWSIIY